MSGPLVIAIPSKGRLQEQSEAAFAAAGFAVEKRGGQRNYRGGVVGRGDVEIAFLSASEIAREVAAGSVHLGVTGEDLVRETILDADRRVALAVPLGFGHADVVVAVPEVWVDVWTMEDLDDVAAGFLQRHGRRLRIATKYWNLTQRHFARHGIALYRIVESLGATEGAPAAGLADLIVDITTTGSTLRANHLKVLDDGVILRSQANLVISLGADWSTASASAARAVFDALAKAGLPADLPEPARRLLEDAA
ncbi:ATP phosphoribosyltransferase [Rhizobiales bacterium L72]|uniref:ATP phosphoribosyltransferase n=1 Tax=Propylenella binzhouense TaxID=2555902 RepID=A0A964T156_9HYPH|nr:ATP phosphoribosyltransferase [Propylenella binzhouense]